MGATISTVSLTTFEIVNELYTAVGSGLLGIVILTKYGLENNRVCGTLFITTVTVGCLVYVFNTHELVRATKNRVVVITGCDSGLGYTIAQYANELGFLVLAGCLDVHSDGAHRLRDGCKIETFELDITDKESVRGAVKLTEAVLRDNPNSVLWAVINNAGIMIFGEFEWQTEQLIQKQLDVNLVGTMRFTNAFCYLLRRYRSRLINVTSHCSLTTLPGLAVYGATKTGLRGFSDALRIEMSKYGVRVINFVPGSFATQSNIMAKQSDYAYEMKASFSEEQISFYGDYFTQYNAYLSAVASSTSQEPKKLMDPQLYECWDEMLLSKTPAANYKCEPWRYALYHSLFRISPIPIHDYFVKLFMCMPDYTAPEETESDDFL